MHWKEVCYVLNLVELRSVYLSLGERGFLVLPHYTFGAFVSQASYLALLVLLVEDIETSLSDYQKALSILERLVEPDSRRIAELYPIQV